MATLRDFAPFPPSRSCPRTSPRNQELPEKPTTPQEAMERTEELLRSVMHLLPLPPDSTIKLGDEVEVPDAADQGGGAAGELGGGAVPEGGRGSGGLGGGAVEVYGRASGLQDGGSVGKGGSTTSNGATEGAGALAGEESEDRAGDDGNHPIDGGLTRYSHNVYCPSLDLYLYCRPLSSFWEKKQTPLVLHDRELLNASRYVHHDKGVVLHRGTDFTREITGILSNHPGPLSSFRIDSSVWSGGSDQLGQWMEMASEKDVEEIIIVNCALPTDLSFPITTLQSPMLRHLSLGFLQIDGLAVADFNYSSLQELSLFGCTYDGDALSAVISECSCLRALVVVGSTKNLSLVTQSLVSLEMSMCTADSLVIEYAPKLQILATGIRPRDGCSSVLIDINSTHSLTEIHYLMLPHHNLTIRSANVREGLMCLSCVRKLRLGVALADSHQRSDLVQVLWRLTNLEDLGIWRMDRVSLAEGSDEAIGSPFTALSSLPCVTVRLTHLLMEEFQGGRAEKALIRYVLGHAQNLLEVKIEPDVASAEQTNIAVTEMLNYSCARERCQIIFQPSSK